MKVTTYFQIDTVRRLLNLRRTNSHLENLRLGLEEIVIGAKSSWWC
jgi:hypothetical protein